MSQLLSPAAGRMRRTRLKVWVANLQKAPPPLFLFIPYSGDESGESESRRHVRDICFCQPALGLISRRAQMPLQVDVTTLRDESAEAATICWLPSISGLRRQASALPAFLTSFLPAFAARSQFYLFLSRCCVHVTSEHVPKRGNVQPRMKERFDLTV